MVAFLKTGVISVVLQSSGTVLLLNAELMTQGHTHSRGNFVLLLVMSAVTGLK